MLILSSFNSKKDGILTPKNQDNRNLINFTASPKSIIKLESSSNIHNNIKSSKNNKNLFLKIKKLITEFETEKNEKEKLNHFKSKKNKTKTKKKINTKKNKKIIGPNTKPSALFIPTKKVFFSVPKIKTQMQFNRYLINDFKENDSEMDYIKRSLKYQKINEDFDELVFLKQIKEVAKNGIAENIMENNQKNEMDFYDTPDSENKNNNSLKPRMTKEISEFNINSILKKNNIYNSNMRRLYTEKIKEIPKNLGKSGSKRDSKRESISNNITINTINQNNNINYTSRTKVSEKENSFIEEKEKEKEKENNNDNIKDNKPQGIKFLMEIKNKNKNNEIRPKKKKITTSIDKFNFSNRLYNAQKNEYNRYMRKKMFVRGKNFSKQIALINKEKEKLGIVDTEEDNEDDEGANTERALPKLIIPNLLFQIEYKDIFKNSFNTLRVVEEGDQDLDLDDLNKIRKAIKDYEIEMIKVLKKNNNLNYIKKHFNKTTVGKFQSTKGIYFGS